MISHTRQTSAPVYPKFDAETIAAANSTSFWMRHKTFSSIFHDIVLWVRPAVTGCTYLALLWIFIIIRAMIPDETSSSFIVVIIAIITVVLLLAGNGIIDVIRGTWFQSMLLSLPELLIAYPRDENGKFERATSVENFFNTASTRFHTFLVELNLSDEHTHKLTILGQCAIGAVFIILAFFFSMFETRTIVVTFLLLFAIVPLVIYHDIITRVYNAILAARGQPVDQPQPAAQPVARPAAKPVVDVSQPVEEEVPAQLVDDLQPADDVAQPADVVQPADDADEPIDDFPQN